jgi:hypothetical protein
MAFDSPELDFMTPESLRRPLWKSLAVQLKETISPEKLPPLRLTSRPVDVGMLPGEMLRLPWYRTIFTNIGDVISPEILPPLSLESRPVDVGELIGDQMSHMWWTSLLRSLADAVAPERQLALELTSAPFDDPTLVSGPMLLPRWSLVIEGPKIFLPDKAKAAYSVQVQAAPVRLDPAEVEFAQVLRDEVSELKSDVRRSRFRARIWVSLAAVEVVVLVGSLFFWK